MKEITDIQQAIAIIHEVGEKHQAYVIDMLRSLTWDTKELKYERDAQKVIDNMELEYALNVANVLWSEKYDQIPEYVKNYSQD
ncbi:hypothetical protein NSQ20_12245 [Paenibacillus sp. FSL K6-1122]|uniref:hypothetical protein n=1 Tax=Paenibacillus sp. FSL K6-1122 TaxID=2954512 RepID=UPI0030EBC005